MSALEAREGLNGISPRSYAVAHQRPKSSFHGCSKISDYKVLGKLGEGTFGEVYRAKTPSGRVVALKKIIMHNEKDGFPITALREIKLLKLLDHENVLKLEDMAVEHPYKSTDKRKRPIMYMVTPYMDHDLSGLLDNPAVQFTIPQIKCYLLQLLRGLQYLHGQHILHRDMKAANLLINNKGILQIADFGLARHYDGPVPVPGGGGGEGRREYTSLVVTRWYRPPELLMSLKRYTTSIDMWGVGCVFGEMLSGKPILTGESDPHQLELIWDICGSPTDESMPGWKELPSAAALNPRPRPGSLSSRFAKYGSGAVSLLKELLKLDWRGRINATDALEHPYFKQIPPPAKPSDIPTFEDSHELDRRKFHDRKANLPPAPKGGTVGMGPQDGGAAGNPGFSTGDSFVPGGRMQSSRGGGGYGPPPRSGLSGSDERRPAWQRDAGLPRRPPPVDHGNSGLHPDHGDRYRERDRDRDRDRDRGGQRRGGGHGSGGGGGGGGNIDTYIPSYHGRDDGPRRDDRGDRRRRDDRDDRRHDWDRDRDRGERGPGGYDERSRTSRTRSRSRSPGRDRDRDPYRR